MRHVSLSWLGGELMALGAIVGSIAQALPPIATLLAIVWYCIMIHNDIRSRKKEKE